MAKRLIFIHGRSFKPNESFLRQSWLEAVEHGVMRDCDAATQARYKALGDRRELVYYGDLSNKLLEKKGSVWDRLLGRKPPSYNAAEDEKDRLDCFASLKTFAATDFRGELGKHHYEELPGSSGLKEFMADASAEALARVHLSESLVASVAPDMAEYWNADTAFGSQVRWGLTERLAAALRAGDDVMLVSHSLGSMIAYDVLWKLSYYGEWQPLHGEKVTCWVTLGSPLGDPTVLRNLKGAKANGPRRFPKNVKQLVNIAAEDDYISHDQTLKDDLVWMTRHHGTEISDHRVFNLAVRYGRSNPHHGVGYLVHPVFVEAIRDWLSD